MEDRERALRHTLHYFPSNPAFLSGVRSAVLRTTTLISLVSFICVSFRCLRLSLKGIKKRDKCWSGKQPDAGASFESRSSSLTHGRCRQRLSPDKLSGSHSVEEVAELCVRRQAHAAVGEAAARETDRES